MSEASSRPAIVIEGLTKRYGRLVAVDNLDLEVHGGEVFGFLGLNGAGKSTTIRVLLDLRRPTIGRARILGHDCQREGLAARASVGHLPGELGFYGDMTGRAVLDLLARLSARPVEPAYRRQLLERIELAESDLDRRLRDYSTGMKRKLGVVQAFQGRAPGTSSSTNRRRGSTRSRRRPSRACCSRPGQMARRCSCPRTSCRRWSGCATGSP